MLAPQSPMAIAIAGGREIEVLLIRLEELNLLYRKMNLMDCSSLPWKICDMRGT